MATFEERMQAAFNEGGGELVADSFEARMQAAFAETPAPPRPGKSKSAPRVRTQARPSAKNMDLDQLLGAPARPALGSQVAGIPQPGYAPRVPVPLASLRSRLGDTRLAIGSGYRPPDPNAPSPEELAAAARYSYTQPQVPRNPYAAAPVMATDILRDIGAAGLRAGVRTDVNLAKLAGNLGLNTDRYVEETESLLRNDPNLQARTFTSGPGAQLFQAASESVGPSILTGALAAPLGPLGMLAAPGLMFGGAEYYDFGKDLEKAGIDPRSQKGRRILSALSEAGFEIVGDIGPGKALGIIAPGLKKAAAKGALAFAKKLVKSFVTSASTEVPSEVATAYAQNALRQGAGINTGQTSLEAGLSAVEPTLYSSALFGGIGAVSNRRGVTDKGAQLQLEAARATRAYYNERVRLLAKHGVSTEAELAAKAPPGVVARLQRLSARATAAQEAYAPFVPPETPSTSGVAPENAPQAAETVPVAPIPVSGPIAQPEAPVPQETAPEQVAAPEEIPVPPRAPELSPEELGLLNYVEEEETAPQPAPPAEAPVQAPEAPVLPVEVSPKPKTTPETQTSVAKEPWQMTREELGRFGENLDVPVIDGLKQRQRPGQEFQKKAKRLSYGVLAARDENGRLFYSQSGSLLDLAPSSVVDLHHSVQVRDALKQGKPVPPEVLAEYPDAQPLTRATFRARIRDIAPHIPEEQLDATLFTAETMAKERGLSLDDAIGKMFSRVEGEGTPGKGALQQAPDTPAFRRWFGKSKVVDEAGKPLVVYHATTKNFQAFDPSRATENTQHPTAIMGMFFSDKPGSLAGFTSKQGNDQLKVFHSIRWEVIREMGDPLDFKAYSPERRVIEDEITRRVSNAMFADGSRTIPAYIKLGNPYLMPFDEWTKLATLHYQVGPQDARSTALETRRQLESEGHDGIIIEASTSKQHAKEYDGRTFIAFSPTQIKSAIGNRGTFDPNDPSIIAQGEKDPKGAYDPTTRVLYLLKGADISTVLHEVFHAYHANLMSAEDDATLQKLLGVKDGKWNKAQRERGARLFERYLRDGKAPNAEVKAVFAKISAWMKVIYKTLKGSDIEEKVSPEARAFFDKLMGGRGVAPAPPTIPHTERTRGKDAGQGDILFQSPEDRARQEKALLADFVDKDQDVVLVHFSDELEFAPKRGIETVPGYGRGVFFYPRGAELPWEGRARSTWYAPAEIVQFVQEFLPGEAGNETRVVEVFVSDEDIPKIKAFSETPPKSKQGDILFQLSPEDRARREKGLRDLYDSGKVTLDTPMGDWARAYLTKYAASKAAKPKPKPKPEAAAKAPAPTVEPPKPKAHAKPEEMRGQKSTTKPWGGSAQHAGTEAVFTEMGIEIPEKRRQTWQEAVDDVRDNNLDANADAFVDRVNRGDALNVRQQAAILVAANKTHAELLAAKKRRDDALKAGDDATFEAAGDTYETLIAKFADYHNALYRVGSELGRSLYARQMIVREDYSTARVLHRARKNKRAELSPEEAARFSEFGKRIEDDRKQLEEIQARDAEAKVTEAETAANNAGVNREKAKIKRQEGARRTVEQIKKDRETYFNDLKALGQLKVYDITGLTAEASEIVYKIARTYIEEFAINGYVKFADVAGAMRQHLPDLTDRQLSEAIIGPKKKPTPLEAQEWRVKRNIEELKAETRRELEKMLPRSFAEKGVRLVAGVQNFLRSMKASFDVSATGRQGFKLITRHPILGSRAVRAQFKALFSSDNAWKIHLAIHESDFQQIRHEAGLKLTSWNGPLEEREETNMSNLAERLPLGVGMGVKASQRAYATMLNTMRVMVFDGEVRRLERAGLNTLENRKAIAAKINIMSGMGSLSGRSTVNLSAVFFAPRNRISHFQLANPLFRGSMKLRWWYAQDLLAWIGTWVGLALLGKLLGADVEFKPNSADFLQLRFGKTRVDIGSSGFKSTLTMLSRLFTRTGYSTRPWLEDEKWDADFGRTIWNYGRYSLAPLVSLAIDVHTGRTAVGEKLDTNAAKGLYALKSGLPFGAEMIPDVLKDQPLHRAIPIIGLGLSGAGVQTYSNLPRR